METLFTGQNLVTLNSVDSTNNYAASLVNATNVLEGTVIVAYEQLSGKGQRGANWQSEAGKNLTCSVVYYPKFLNPSQQFYLSMSVALAVYDTLSAFLPELKIKWPNDLYCRNKKIAGILIENSVSDHGLLNSIIGIGINVNQIQFNDLNFASSIKLETGNEINISDLLNQLCVHLEKWYLRLKNHDFSLIKMNYFSVLLNFEKKAQFELNNLVFSATITDIAENGFIELTLENGDKSQYDIKSIKQLI